MSVFFVQTRRHQPGVVIAVLALASLAAVASAALFAAPHRVTLNLASSALSHPIAMLKVERPGAVQPTYLVGRGEWGEVSIDLRADSSRHEARGVLTFPHLERNDPANLDKAIAATWLSREGDVLVKIKLIDITAIQPSARSGDPHGEITFTASLEGVRGGEPITFTGEYLVEENGLAVRTEAQRSGDVLTLTASATVEAAALGWGAQAPASEPVTLTLWFQAAEE